MLFSHVKGYDLPKVSKNLNHDIKVSKVTETNIFNMLEVRKMTIVNCTKLAIITCTLFDFYVDAGT